MSLKNLDDEIIVILQIKSLKYKCSVEKMISKKDRKPEHISVILKELIKDLKLGIKENEDASN